MASLNDYTYEFGDTFITSLRNPRQLDKKPCFAPVKIYRGTTTQYAVVPVVGEKATFDYSQGGRPATDPRLFALANDTTNPAERQAAITQIDNDGADFMRGSYLHSSDGRIDRHLPATYGFCTKLCEETMQNHPDFFAFGQNPNINPTE